MVEFVDDLPRTATGKMQRYKLREAEAVRRRWRARVIAAPRGHHGVIAATARPPRGDRRHRAATTLAPGVT